MTTGLEAKLATGLLKPATSFVDALLGPKVEKLKKWSKERELSKLLNDNKPQLLLESYVERTIKKASELSTIVFPQARIQLNEVFEPLSLSKIKKTHYSPVESSDTDVELDIQSPARCYFIIDEAGMGKSTFLKNIALKVITETDKIPVLFELSGYNKNFSLVENLARCFDNLDKVFDRDLFNKLTVTGKLFIVLDGFDELSADLQEKLKPEFVDLNEKKGESSLVLSSRPQENFPNLVQSSYLQINKLNRNQAKSLVLKYDAVANLDIGKRLINEFEKIPARFLETPLLVGLLYRTYGFNNTIAEKISVFYGEIFDALYKGHDLTKSGYVREKTSGLNIDSFRALLRSLSFLYIAKSSDGSHTFDTIVKLIGDAQKLCPTQLESPRLFANDLLLAVPLLMKEGSYVKFMHRTIAEYFAAEYIVNADNSSLLLKKIYSGTASNSFKQVIEFVYEISPNIYNEAITKPIALKYIEDSKGVEMHPICRNSIFQSEGFISYWRYDDVVEIDPDDRHMINLPTPSSSANSFSYFYGEQDGEKYVACISSGDTRHKIPRSAFLEISSPLDENALKISFERIDDLDFGVITKNLDVSRWYPTDSDDIAKISYFSSIQEIFCRGIFDYSANSVGNGDTFRIIDIEKARSLIDSLERLNKAQADLDALLG